MARSRQPRPAQYVACYGLWFVLILLAYALFLIWRKTALFLIFAVLGAALATDTAYLVIMLLLGLVLFVFIMAGEPYLRGGLPRGQLLSRFTYLALPLAGIIALGLALQELIYVLAGYPVLPAGP